MKYEGKYPLDKCIFNPSAWIMEDLLHSMDDEGIPLTDANIDAILNNRFERLMSEWETADGWDTIRSIIWDTDFPD